MAHPIETDCPTCGALAGLHCIGKRGGPRKAFHRARGVRRAAFADDIAPVEVESPIERILADTIWEWIETHEASYAHMQTQVPIGPYRADIVIDVFTTRLIVECDGRTFHSSREQIERDKRRDRYCAINGWAVMRFTGDEIRRDARGCAAQVGIWIRRFG